MALDIMGLFNTQSVNPYQQQQQAFQQNLMQSTNPQQFAATVGSNMGGQLAGAIPGLFGMQSEEDKKNKAKQDALAEVQSMNIDPTDKNAVGKALVMALQRRGLNMEAMQVGQSLEAPAKEAGYKPASDIGKLMADQARFAEGSPQWNAYQAAIDKATKDKEAAPPEIIKLMDAAGITDQKKRREVANQYLTTKLSADKGDPTALKAIELMGKQLDLQIKQQKLKEAEIKGSQKEAIQGESIEGVKRTVEEAKNLVSGWTTGVGSLLSSIPATPAKDLSVKLGTIKANLGFDRLQQMRDASPTGGALGQVAIQELDALQSTIASLDQDQSPEQLKNGLDKISKHYNNWLAVMKGEKPLDNGSLNDTDLINKYLSKGK